MEQKKYKCNKCGYSWIGEEHPCINCEKESFDEWFDDRQKTKNI